MLLLKCGMPHDNSDNKHQRFLNEDYFNKNRKSCFKIQIPNDYFHKIDYVILVLFPHFNWLYLKLYNSFGQKVTQGVTSNCYHLY